MPELIERRTRNSKTFHLGGRKYAWSGVIGAIHYKDNPKDEAEQWKDIDTTIIDGKVRKAPYDLDVYLDGMPGLHYKSKESGEFDVRLKCARSAIKVIEPVIPKHRIEGNKVIWENIYPDTDVVLEAQNTRVSLKRILKSAKAPLEYDVDIQEVKGVAKLRPLRPATDANGQQLVMEEKSITGGRTEKLRLEVLPREFIEPQSIAFPIEDSTEVDEQVGESIDDCWSWSTTGFDSDDATIPWRGYSSIGFRFRTVAVPQGATIDAAKIIVSANTNDNNNFEVYIQADDADDSAVFSSGDRPKDRALTTASVTWTGQPIWYTDNWVDSPDISTVVKEVVDRPGWASDNNFSICTGDHAHYTYRNINTYDGDTSKAPKLHIEYTVGGVTHEGAATLSGVGTLTAIGRGIFVGKATLSGAGTLAGIGRGIFTGKSTLSGTGTLAGIGRLIATGKATLSGVGTLAAIGRLIAVGKATLSGIGTLACIGRGIFTGKATLAGTGTLVAIGRLMAIGKATLSGTGTLSAIGSFWRYGKATLSGIGTLSAIGRIIAVGKATLSGTGTLVAKGVGIFAAKATLAGTGTLSAIGNVSRILYGAATLAGQGTLTAIGHITAIGKATLSGVGTLTARGVGIFAGKATLAGVGTLSAAGFIVKVIEAIVYFHKRAFDVFYHSRTANVFFLKRDAIVYFLKRSADVLFRKRDADVRFK